MAGVGQSDLPVVSAGVQSAPLVTPADPNVLGSNAVSNLVDAFHQGFITQDDIINRVGDIGQAKNKALLEQLGEYVSPGMIESRKAQAAAEKAKADLAVQSSGVASKILSVAGPQQVGSAETRGLADQYFSLAPLYGMPTRLTDANGNEDFQAEANAAIKLNQIHNLRMMGQMDPTIKPQEEKQSDGSIKTYYFSKTPYGVFKIDPETLDSTQKAIQSVLPELNAIRFQQEARDKRHGTVPAVTPSAGAPEHTAAPAQVDVSPIGETPTASSPLDVLSAVPVAGQPATTSQVQNKDTRDAMNSDGAFKVWSSQKGGIASYRGLVKELENIGENPTKDPGLAQKRLELERGLVYAVSQLQQNEPFDQVPRGLWHNWEDVLAKVPLEPLGAKLKNELGKLTGNKPISTAQVEALKALGDAAVRGKEAGALPAIQYGGQHNPGALFPDELQLFKGGGAGETGKTPAPSASSVPTKKFSKSAPPPKDQIITTPQGRLKSLGDGTFLPLP